MILSRRAGTNGKLFDTGALPVSLCDIDKSEARVPVKPNENF